MYWFYMGHTVVKGEVRRLSVFLVESLKYCAGYTAYTATSASSISMHVQ